MCGWVGWVGQRGSKPAGAGFVVAGVAAWDCAMPITHQQQMLDVKCRVLALRSYRTCYFEHPNSTSTHLRRDLNVNVQRLHLLPILTIPDFQFSLPSTHLRHVLNVNVQRFHLAHPRQQPRHKRFRRLLVIVPRQAEVQVAPQRRRERGLAPCAAHLPRVHPAGDRTAVCGLGGLGAASMAAAAAAAVAPAASGEAST